MSEYRKFSHILQRSHYFLSILVVVLFLCVEFDNPVDPKFKGSYTFDILNLKDTVTLSIFQLHAIKIDTSSSKNNYHDFSCTVEKDSVAVDSQLVKNHFVLFFYKPCTTTVYVNGIRPNDIKDSKELTFIVHDNFQIEGNDFLAKNDTVAFKINRPDSFDVISTIKWSFGNVSSVRSIDSSFKVFWRDSIKDFDTLKAKLFYNDTVFYDLMKVISFKGYAPKIEKATIKNADTSKKNLNQVDYFKVFLNCDDPDSNPYTITIKDGSGTLQSKEYNTYTPNCTLLVPPVKKPDTNSLKIIMTDNMGYSDTFDTVIVVDTIVPQVYCYDTITVAVRESLNFELKSVVNCDSFNWVMEDSAGCLIVQSISNRTNWQIKSPDSIGTYKIIVTPVNTHNPKVIADTTILIVKEFAYSTVFHDESKDTITLKVNRPYELKVKIKVKSQNISSIGTLSGVKYFWSYPDGVAKYISETDSSIIMYFVDSVDTFNIAVYGLVDGEKSERATLNVIVNNFSPVFSIIDTSCSTTVNKPFKFNIRTTLTDPEMAPIEKYYYKIAGLNNAPIMTYDSAYGMKIGAVGTFHIEMWCVDRDGAKSNTGNIKVSVGADLPYITYLTLLPDTIPFPTDSLVRITGMLAKPGYAGHPVDSIMWDSDNDGIYEKSKKATGNDTIFLDRYSQPTLITVSIRCKDISGDFSLPVKKYIRIFSDIPEITRFSPKDTLKTNYIHTPVDFITNITDPDDSVLSCRIVAYDSVYYNGSVKRNLDSISIVFRNAGSYRISLFVNDTKDNKDTFSLPTPLVIDSGIPVISNFAIKKDSVYINDPVTCTITAGDPNGTIKEYRYYVNSLDSTPIIKNNDSAFAWTFKNPGTYKIYAVVVDNDNFRSLVKEDSVVVRKGQPVVDSLLIDSHFVYVDQSVKFTFVFSDTNGTIQKRQIIWNTKDTDTTTKTYQLSDTVHKVKDTETRTFSKSDTGQVIIKIRIQDNDGMYSEWKSDTIIVDKGIPRIDSIKIESKEVIYINDSLKLIIKASDPNNKIQSVGVSWRNDGSFSPLSYRNEIAVYEVQKSFSKADTIIDSIRIRVIDTTGFLKDSLYKLTVLPGRPVIESFSPLEVWVKKTNTFTITAHDVNIPASALDSFKVSFDSSRTWRVNTTGIFDESFQDTSRTGLREVIVRVRDNDFLWTEKKFTLNVKLGRPIVSGFNNYGDPDIQWKAGSINGTDSMFYKWKPGSPTLIAVDTTDNDSCVRFFWNWDSDDFIDVPTTEPKLSVTGLRSNQINRVTVTCWDNDSIKSFPYAFFVFPDGPPPVITTTSDASIGARIIKWSGKDTKDSNNTLYKIVAKRGTASAMDSVTTADESNPDYIISDFKTGAQYETDNAYDFKFNYTTSETGIYHYRIIARDARGAESRTGGDPQFSF